MGTQLELAKKRLFDEKALKVGNIKLFPGSNRDTTAEEMAEEINKSLSRIETGNVVILDDDVELYNDEGAGL